MSFISPLAGKRRANRLDMLFIAFPDPDLLFIKLPQRGAGFEFEPCMLGNPCRHGRAAAHHCFILERHDLISI